MAAGPIADAAEQGHGYIYKCRSPSVSVYGPIADAAEQGHGYIYKCRSPSVSV